MESIARHFLTNIAIKFVLKNKWQEFIPRASKDGQFLLELQNSGCWKRLRRCISTLIKFMKAIYLFLAFVINDRLCGLVVPGYRSRGPGSIPGADRFSEK
jgi:hypothetical protein